MDEAKLETTIHQHDGTHPNGPRMMRFVKITTSWLDVADEGPWESLTERDREWYWNYVTKVHAARCELASLDCEARAAAFDWLDDQDRSNRSRRGGCVAAGGDRTRPRARTRVPGTTPDQVEET